MENSITSDSSEKLPLEYVSIATAIILGTATLRPLARIVSTTKMLIMPEYLDTNFVRLGDIWIS